MKASNVMGIVCSMVGAASYSQCMQEASHLLDYEKHMAQFSRSLDELAQEVTDLSKQQIGQRGCGRTESSSSCPVNLATIKEMQSHITQVRESLDPKKSRVENMQDTEVLHEVQSVFCHLERRLEYTRNRLDTYNLTPAHQRGKLLHSALDPLVEMQGDLNGLFGICDNYHYVSPHNNTIIQALLTQARTFSLAKLFMLAQSFADPAAAMAALNNGQPSSSGDQVGDFSDHGIAMGVMNNNQKLASWSDNLHKSVDKYRALYEDRARIAIDLAEKDPKHITSVFTDLSHRLCGSKFCKPTQENLKLIEKLCMESPQHCTTLKEMKEENSLTAHKLAQLLTAAMPHVVSSGRILESVEAVAVTAANRSNGVGGYLKKKSCQAVVECIKKAGIANKKELDSLTKHAEDGEPVSKRIQEVTRIIQQYHLEGAMNTVIAALEGFDMFLTIAMGRAADAYIECEQDSAKILTIVRDLKGCNVKDTRKSNAVLLSYLRRLKTAWEYPAAVEIEIRPSTLLDGGTSIEGEWDGSSDSFDTASQGGSDYQSAEGEVSRKERPTETAKEDDSGSDLSEEELTKDDDKLAEFERSPEYADFLELLSESGQPQICWDEARQD